MPRNITRTTLLAAAFAATALLAGCGFVSASGKSDTKPSGFVLIGHATVVLPATATGSTGVACTAPGGAGDVAANTPVTVTDNAGHRIASGVLGSGVVAPAETGLGCQFPFTIRAVPGGLTVYRVAIGNRPAQQFSGADLSTNTPAVITITPGA